MRRTDRIPEEETGGIAVVAADPGVRRTLGATLARGRFLDAATARYPVVVLGAIAAARLGVDRPGARVFLGERSVPKSFAAIGKPISAARSRSGSRVTGPRIPTTVNQRPPR